MIRLIVVAAGAIGLIVFVSLGAVRLIQTRRAGLSIRMQFFLALALVVGAFAFGLGLLVLDRVKARANLVAHEAALDEAQAVAALVAADMKSGHASLAQVASKLRRGQAGGEGPELHLALLDQQGELVFESGRPPEDETSVSVSVAIAVDETTVGTVRVVKPTLSIKRTLADFAPTVLVISLLLGGVAAAAAARIGRTIATPIEELTAFAERVSKGERRTPAPRGRGREVQRLTRAIDSMRLELQGRPFVETFAADLSHELKNPVAAIRASAEVLRDGAIDEPDQAHHFVARILESTSRIEALLGDLLNLARFEARSLEDARRLELGAQVERAVAAARERGAQVELELRDKAWMRGDDAWLGRAVENLLDNARVHGSRNEPVQVVVDRHQGMVRCRVLNAGQIASHVKKRLFRRFITTRADRGGTGLGLALVRAVAEAHGGVATCVASGPPEVIFEIAFPAD